MKDIAHEFEMEITKAASMILAASHNAAQAVLDEVFSQRTKIHRVAKNDAGRRTSGPNRFNVRRSPADIGALADCLMQEIWASPGQTITALSSRMEVRAAELKVPIRRLKRQGKLRTAGVHQFTRYFPVSMSSQQQPA